VGGVSQRLATIADIDTPQTAHRVKQLLTLGVPNINALGAGDDTRATGGQVAVVGERMHEMGAVKRLNVFGVHRCGGGRVDHESRPFI
jgi:hypothetical protein